MNYVCKQGVTLKSGKHYGYTDVISEEEYNKLNKEIQVNFEPQEEDASADESGEEETEDDGRDEEVS